jgi:8-oxo-dGTP pyrophosphatase MutT (NUDIX family)
MAKLAARRHRANLDGTPLRQIATLPFRRAPTGGVEILVVTSRETKRFIIPKGWSKAKKSTWKSAEVEAREEAGLVGKIKRRPIGQYRYWKRLKSNFALVEVDVYPLKVEKRLKNWPERDERTSRWLAPQDAALLIDEPQLVSLIRNFSRQSRPKKVPKA